MGVGMVAASWTMTAFRDWAGWMPRATSLVRMLPVVRCVVDPW